MQIDYLNNIKNVHDMVLDMLESIPATRNDDHLLVEFIYERHYPKLSTQSGSTRSFYCKLYKDASRHRAHIQNDLRLYPPTSFEVARSRNKMCYAKWYTIITGDNLKKTGKS
jgi:hypothetical protein